MSFDKAKVIRAAEKYLTQGKILPAISEYRKITAQDPSDFTALNMLGDLFARVDKKQEAMECFTRIANHYREQGFNLKAIAMLKKIDRLDPANPDMAYQLATLYEAQGLAVDARTQYLVVADYYTKQNDVRKTLEILHRIADLDPHNVEPRLKLAEGYLRENMGEQAASAFTEAGSQLLSRGHYERAIEAFNRALEFSTANHTAWSGVVMSYTALNAPDEAARALCEAGALESNDIELITLLAQAYVADENVNEAEQVASLLLKVDPAGYTPLLDVARLHLKLNQLDDCVRVLGTIADPILNARAETALIYVLDEALARNPEHLSALHLLVSAYKWQHEEEGLRKTLERIVEVAHTLELPDEEYQALEQLNSLTPNNQQYRQRLSELTGVVNASPESSAPLMPESEVAFYDSLAGLTADVAHTEDSADSNTAEFVFTDTPEEVPGAPASPVEEPPANAAAASEDPHEKALQQELESVEFYIGQGYYDIAQDTLGMLERQFGERPNIAACKQQLALVQGLAAPSEEVSFSEEMSFSILSDEASATPLSSDAVAAEATPTDTETGFFLTEDSTPAPEFKTAVAEDVLLIMEEDALLTVFQAEPAPEAVEIAAMPEIVAPADKPALDPGLVAIFDEFREAVEEESQMPSDDDYETHYNLGLAYKEMDLLDEAVEEFQIAAKLVAPLDGSQHHLDCCSLLGHCFMQKDLPRVAVRWFQKGLDTLDLPEEAILALRYETALAYEKMGDIDKATETFMEVYGVNVNYRGVGDKVRALQSLQPV